MKSICLEEPGKVLVKEIKSPLPAEAEALIKVKSVGICGSDIGAFRGSNPLVSYPRILGHEISGEVLSIPENKKGIKKGDHVVVDPFLSCGCCYPCSIGRTNCCTSLRVLGVHVDGGMSEYFTHPANMLVKLPKDMPWEIAAFAEPLTIALHGLHRSRVSAGEHIAISGAGPIGLLAAMAAVSYGAYPIMIDPVEERLARARQLGVEFVINPSVENAEKRVEEITCGRMAEVVMEASGANSAICSTIKLVSHAGRISLTGWPKGETPIDTGMITKKEIDIYGARTSAGEFEEAIDLIYSNKVDVRSILTKTVSIEELPETLRDIDKNPGKYLKVIGIL